MQDSWQNNVIYNIYPGSFGDLRFISSKLGYLEKLGIDVICLHPVFCSPDAGNGYDISDHTKIDPRYGDLDDLDLLIKAAGERSLKIIMDLPIDQTSDEHDWFKKSRDKENPYRTCYFWQDKNIRPKKLSSFYGESAWHKDELTGDYYLHLYSKRQPDLDYHDPKVLTLIKEIMELWLERGISGFRLTGADLIWKEPYNSGIKSIFSTDKVNSLIKEMTEDVTKPRNALLAAKTVFSPLSGSAFDIVCFAPYLKKRDVASIIREIIKEQSDNEPPGIFLEDHDQPRFVSRFKDSSDFREIQAKLTAIILLTLPGTPFIYQGQELGIPDVRKPDPFILSSKRHKGKVLSAKKENARIPFPWDEQAGGIFRYINAVSQEKDPVSVLSFHKKMISLRKNTLELQQGGYRVLEIRKTYAVYERYLAGNGSLRIIINLSNKGLNIPCEGSVLLSNYHRKSFGGDLFPYEGIIIRVL